MRESAVAVVDDVDADVNASRAPNTLRGGTAHNMSEVEWDGWDVRTHFERRSPSLCVSATNE